MTFLIKKRKTVRDVIIERTYVHDLLVIKKKILRFPFN